MGANEPWPKLFTPEEANRMLPLVRRIAEDIRDTHRLLVERYPVYVNAVDAMGQATSLHEIDARQEEEVALRDELEEYKQRIHDYAVELAKLGVQLKGESDGLVDFPSLRDGRVVLLCWRLGEPSVAHWHEIEAGFAGRQPLEEAMPALPR